MIGKCYPPVKPIWITAGYNRDMHRSLGIMFVAVCVILLAGCSASPTPAGSTARSWAFVEPTLTPLLPGPQDTALSPGGTPPQPLDVVNQATRAGSLSVALFTDREVEVSTSPFVLQGAAPAGTVISVNEQVLVVDSSGAFSVEIPLEEGPNLVEVIASNAAGDEADYLLTITYNP